VFLPLISITGVTGTFFRALAVTMTVSLFTSLVLALTWTPTLSQFFIRKKQTKEEDPAEPEDEHEEDINRLLAAEDASVSGFFLKIVTFHEKWLRRALQHPRKLAFLSLILVALSYGCYHFLGSDLLPEMDEGSFVLDYIMPAGSSLAETNRVISHVEEMLRETPEWKAPPDGPECSWDWQP